MKPIIANPVIPQGIALYAPPLEGSSALFELSIYYRETNPLFSWLQCSNEEQLLWVTSQRQTNQGVIFLYQEPLRGGYYRLELKADDGKVVRSGALPIAITKPTPYLMIGLPYSIYPPITLG